VLFIDKDSVLLQEESCDEIDHERDEVGVMDIDNEEDLVEVGVTVAFGSAVILGFKGEVFVIVAVAVCVFTCLCTRVGVLVDVCVGIVVAEGV
jgi:hypothetical protein